MNFKYTPAIIVIGYNRINSFKRLLYSLNKANYNANNIPIIISLDKSDQTQKLKKISQDFIWKYGEKKINIFNTKQGLRSHILQCGDMSSKYGSVIILEDDIVVGPDFYNYVRLALEYYHDVDSIAGIALYSHKYNSFAGKAFEPLRNGYDTFCAQFSVTWGQCWTAQQWNAFKKWYLLNSGDLAELDQIPNQITNWPVSSWGKYFVYYMILNHKYYVMPYDSQTTCFADQGEHTKQSNSTKQVPVFWGKRKYNFVPFDLAEKYDIFMEHINLHKYLSQSLESKDICINLYGCKNNFGSYRYMLTLNHMNYKIVKSYGLRMYPMELNIIYNIPGNDIFLYDCTLKQKNKFRRHSSRIRDYEMRGINTREALHYCFEKAIQKIIKFGT